MDTSCNLSSRLADIERRLGQLEVSTSCSAEDNLAARQLAILARISKLEKQQGIDQEAGSPTNAGAAVPEYTSETHKRLQDELLSFGITNFRFVRAPPEYYDQPLEFRQAVLNAASIHHLCKTIVMENTRAHPSVDGWSNPHNSKYYLVIVQYSARLHAEKLKNFIHKLNNGAVGKQYFNMRLAPEEVSDRLSGFEHNAVSPIAIATRLPIVMSHMICELDPPFFWIGAGEVDLKVGLDARDFVDKYQPIIADCTY